MMGMQRIANEKQFAIMLGITLFALISCREYMPKPRGYFRIEPPKAVYSVLSVGNLPYSFECPQMVNVDTVTNQEYGALTLFYPALNASLYCGYVQVNTPTELAQSMDEAISLLTRQHKVTSVEEKRYENPDRKIYGSLYILKGDCVSPLQFVLTDHVGQLFRGALYYNFQPSADSIAPVTDYLLKDVMHLMESFQWKNINR